MTIDEQKDALTLVILNSAISLLHTDQNFLAQNTALTTQVSALQTVIEMKRAAKGVGRNPI